MDMDEEFWDEEEESHQQEPVDLSPAEDGEYFDEDYGSDGQYGGEEDY